MINTNLTNKLLLSSFAVITALGAHANHHLIEGLPLLDQQALSTPFHPQSIARLEEAFPLIGKKSVVIFDIHHTLIRPKQQLGTRKWGIYVYHKLLQEGVPPSEAKKETFRRLRYVMLLTDMIPVEPDTASFVRELQDSGIQVMALTASPYHPIISQQLLDAGIDLSYNPPLRETCDLISPGGPHYEGGILYCAIVNKGDVLKAFFEKTGIQPEHVVYIDDREDEVCTLKSVLDLLDLNSACIHYSAAAQAEVSIEPAVVDLQWEMLGKILSDAQAHALIRQLEEGN